MQSQIHKSLKELNDKIKKKINFLKKNKETNKKNIANIVKNNLLKENLKTLFTLNSLSQLLDETNLLSEISHKRKVTCLGDGGINIKRANLKIREIDSSQYGKICPIETPEGKNAGLVLSFANEIRINNEGIIETPFFLRKIKKKEQKKEFILLKNNQILTRVKLPINLKL